MKLDLTGRHALVCGGSAGIGRAAAVELAALGAEVTVLARSEGSLEALARSLPRAHGQPHGWIVADVLDTQLLRTKVEALVTSHPVHILVNNTGGPPGGPAHAAGTDEYQRAFQAHVVAAQSLLQAVLPGMREANWGRVINVISISVREPIAGLGVSNTIRGAMASWAKTLSSELGPHGITVNNVLPGFTRTDRLDALIADKAAKAGCSQEEIARGMLAQVPAGRFAEPEETAAAIAFLASPAAAYINGVSLPVDGGRIRSL